MRSTDTDRGRRAGEGIAPRWMWGAFFVASILFFVGVVLELDGVRLVAKAAPAACLAVGVLVTDPRTAFRRLVAIGLAFGAAGDLLLELDAFVPGLVAFLVGHLLYVVAFVRLSARPSIPLAMPYLVAGVALTAFVAEGAGELLVPVVAYAIVISVMGWRSAALVGEIAARTAIPLAVGAGLFIVSDALIAVNRFRSEIPAAEWWIMLTYLSAQALIALGAGRSDAP